MRKPFLLLLLPFLFSCNISQKSDAKSYEMADGDFKTDNSSAVLADLMFADKAVSGSFTVSDTKGNNGWMQPTSEALANRKMIWTADMHYQVTRIDSASRAINQMAAAKGGFVSNLNRQDDHYKKQIDLTIRIPNDAFQDFIGSSKSVASFLESEQIRSEDVTARYIDVESRLDSKREARIRYMDILKNKTGDVEAVIQAEDAIRRITEEIEAKESTLRSLKDQIAMSTVRFTLIEKKQYEARPDTFEKSFGSKAGDALGAGWSGIQSFILVLLYIWPLLLFIAVVIVLIRYFVRRKKIAKKTRLSK